MSKTPVFAVEAEGGGIRELCPAGRKMLTDIVGLLHAPVEFSEFQRIISAEGGESLRGVGVNIGGTDIMAIKDEGTDFAGRPRTYYMVPEKGKPGVSVYLDEGDQQPKKLCTVVNGDFQGKVWVAGDRISPEFAQYVKDNETVMVDGKNPDETITTFRYSRVDGGRILEATPRFMTAEETRESMTLIPFKNQTRTYGMDGRPLKDIQTRQ